MTEPALRFAFAMTSDAPGPDRLGALALGGALNRQYWIGQLSSGGKTSGPMRHLLMCDLSAGAGAGFEAAPDLVTWFGAQILPGSQEAAVGAGALLVNLMNVDAAHDEEFNDWYDTEHIERMKQVEGLLAARRFRAIDGSPLYAAFYHFTDPSVHLSPAWAQAAGTPWTTRMQGIRTDPQRMAFTPVTGLP